MVVGPFCDRSRPIENRLCAVKNNNDWIRARCLAVSKDKQIVKLQYIDWGNIVHLQSKGKRDSNGQNEFIWIV